jgi:L-asparaginase
MRTSFTPFVHSSRNDRIEDRTRQAGGREPPAQTSEPDTAAAIATGRKRIRIGEYKLNWGIPLAPRKEGRHEVAYIPTGGTASAVGDNDVTYTAGAITGTRLLDDVDIPHGMLVCVYDAPVNGDSKNFTPKDRHAICNDIRDKLRTIKEGESILVIHGTDTKELTAFQAALTIPKDEMKGKKVIFVGAMKPHSSPERDGPANQSYGLRFAKKATTASGVFTVANKNGDVLRPPFFRKAETIAVAAFIPVNEDIAAKIKQHPITRQYRLKMKAAATDQNYSVYPLAKETVFPPVAEISSQNVNEAGFIINTIEAQIKAGANILVYEGPGDVYIRDDLDKYLRGLAEKGVLIIRTTDAGNGEVVRNGGYPDDEAGTICAGKLLPKMAKVLAQCVWASASQAAARNGTTLSNEVMHKIMEAAFAEYQSEEYRAEEYRSPS